jgi:prepilin-type N-terminal cleavage/methylation domain-containing protein
MNLAYARAIPHSSLVRTSYKTMKKTPPIASFRIRIGGFSLVEVMIAITLGLLLTAAVLQLFVGTQQHSEPQMPSAASKKMPHAQSVLNQELRMVGYRGFV